MRKIFILTILFTAIVAQSAFAFLGFGWRDIKRGHAAPAAELASKPLSLQEAYQLSLKQSEAIGIQAEEIGKAHARFFRAFDYFLPTAHFEMDRFYQDVGKDASGSDGITGDSRRRFVPTDKFVFHQPLFSGFKELAAIQGTGADKKEQHLRLKRAKELLFIDVMESYYELLRARKDLAVLDETRKIMTDRLKELEGRVRLGRTKESDQLSSSADLKVIEADWAETKAVETTLLNLFEFYIGQPLNDRPLEDSEMAETLKELPVYLEKAKTRSDVQAEEQADIVADKGVLAAQSDLIPKVSLDGNYYTKRTGFQSGTDWDVMLKFDVPIFELGTTLGDIREATATKAAASLMARQTRRIAERDIKDAYERLHTSELQEKSLGEAADATKQSYTLISDDYGHNLVNNLEVLDALRRYQEIERRSNTASYERKKNFWRFKAALGEIET